MPDIPQAGYPVNSIPSTSLVTISLRFYISAPATGKFQLRLLEITLGFYGCFLFFRNRSIWEQRMCWILNLLDTGTGNGTVTRSEPNLPARSCEPGMALVSSSDSLLPSDREPSFFSSSLLPVTIQIAVFVRNRRCTHDFFRGKLVNRNRVAKPSNIGSSGFFIPRVAPAPEAVQNPTLTFKKIPNFFLNLYLSLIFILT